MKKIHAALFIPVIIQIKLFSTNLVIFERNNIRMIAKLKLFSRNFVIF